MDERERAIFESRMQNEDEIVALLEGNDTMQQRALAEMRGWAPERLDRLRHFAGLRRKAIDTGRAELLARRAVTPKLTDPGSSQQERALGVYVEQIEPQVREAVRTLVGKGYWPTYSGFNQVDGPQIIKMANVDVGGLALTSEASERLKALGFSIELRGRDVLLHTEKLPELNEIKQAWDVAANGLPDRPPRDAWRVPTAQSEWGEIERTSEALGIPVRDITAAFRSATLEELSDEDWDGMRNCDSSDKAWTLEHVLSYYPTRPDHPRDPQKILDAMSSGDTLPAPVVLYRKGQPPYLIGGSTRLSVARATGRRPRVLAVRM